MIQVSLGSSIAQHFISLKYPFTEHVNGDDIDILERSQIQQKMLYQQYK